MPSLPSKVAVVLTIWFIAVFFALQVAAIYVTVQRVGAPEPQPALFIDKFEIQTPVVQPGDTVRISMTARRQMACLSIIASFWMSPDGHAAVRFPPITGGYTSVDMKGYTIPIDLPAPATDTLTGKPLPPGVYTYRSINAPLCDDMLPTESPPVSVCLVVPGQPLPACAKGDPAG